MVIRDNDTLSETSELRTNKFQTQIYWCYLRSPETAVPANKCLTKSWYALREEVKYHTNFQSINRTYALREEVKYHTNFQSINRTI